MKRAKVTNYRELEKETKRERCLNCDTVLTAQMGTMFGSFWSCSSCGYDDYSKTLLLRSLQNPKIKYTLDYTYGKPFGQGGYEYINGIKTRDLSLEDYERDYVWK